MPAQVDILLQAIDQITGPSKKAAKAVEVVVNESKKFGRQEDVNKDKAKGVNEELQKTKGILGRARDAVKKFGKDWSSVISTAAVGALTGAIASAANHWQELANIQAVSDSQLRAGIASTGAVAGRTAEQLIAASEELEDKTLKFFDKENIKDAQAILLTFTQVRGAVYDQAMPAILDMSARLGTDLKQQAMQVGKALNDPLLGITALRRAGVQLTESQTAQVEKLMAAGKKEEAQMILLAELNNQFGGSAVAAGNAGAGAWRDMVKELDGVREELGFAIIPLLNSLGEVFKPVLLWLQDLSKWLQENPKVVKIMAVAVGALAGAVTIAAGAIAIMNAALWANPIVWIIAAVVALAAAVAAVVVYWDNIRLAVTNATLWVMEKIEGLGEWLFGWIAKIGKWLWDHSPFKMLVDVLDNIFPGFKAKLKAMFDWFYQKFIQPIVKLWNWVKGLFGGEKTRLEAKIEAENNDDKKKQAQAKTGYAPATPFVADAAGASTGTASTDAAQSAKAEGNVSGGGGMKMITINIGRLIGIEKLDSHSSDETVSQTAERLKAALLTVVNDANLT